MLNAREIYYGVNGLEILKGIDVSFRSGQFSMILGPNGSGKSTLLKIISGDLMPDHGRVAYGLIECKRENMKKLSQVRATLSQQSSLSFPMSVEDVVMMGRYPHFDLRPTVKDKEICHLAMEKLNCEKMRHKNYLTLSGGERQRVHFAKTLAQIWEDKGDTQRFLLLDEPIASLDPNYQHEFLSIAWEWSRKGVVVVAVMHDVNLASRYGDYFVAMKSGEILAEGNDEDVMTPKVLSRLYGIPCFDIPKEGNRSPLFIFSSGVV